MYRACSAAAPSRSRWGKGETILRVFVDGEEATTLAKPRPGKYRIDGLPAGDHACVAVATESQPGRTASTASCCRPTRCSALAQARTPDRIHRRLAHGRLRQPVDDPPVHAGRSLVAHRQHPRLRPAAVAAQFYDADYRVHAISGRGVVRNYDGFAGDTPPQAYPYVLFDHSVRDKDDGWQPQAIVIALGTNDFSNSRCMPGELLGIARRAARRLRRTFAGFVRSCCARAIRRRASCCGRPTAPKAKCRPRCRKWWRDCRTRTSATCPWTAWRWMAATGIPPKPTTAASPMRWCATSTRCPPPGREVRAASRCGASAAGLRAGLRGLPIANAGDDAPAPRFRDAPLLPGPRIADPSAHVFAGRIYIYGSHDVDEPARDGDSNQFVMRDYRVLSMASAARSPCTWSRWRWPTCPGQPAARVPDAAERDGRYYLYFPAKDKHGVFRIGVAVGDRPEGPFKPQPKPIRGSYSIDLFGVRRRRRRALPAVRRHLGGQLQRWKTWRKYDPAGGDTDLQRPDAPALMPRIARLRKDMLEFVEPPARIADLDASGNRYRAATPPTFLRSRMDAQARRPLLPAGPPATPTPSATPSATRPTGPFIERGIVLPPVQVI